jgi:SAM-dependent methyltransferase
MMQLGYTVNDFFGSNLTNYDVERLDRVLELSDDERGEIGTVLRSYTDWHYPTLEIGPGDGDWTESLVAGDPLYIVDRHQEFLDSTLAKFNEVYQKRLRPYLTGLHADRPEFDYSMLPQGQFGFIFAWNVVNFWPLKETKHTLSQCWDLLKPGGAMMFSFNNCDVVQCAEAAETGYKSYLTPKLLNDIFNELGFQVIQYRSTSVNVHWVEIKKPGVLQTSKRHQTLGKILTVHSGPEVDTDQDNMYNAPKYSKEEIANLKRQAVFLKIDTPDKIYKAYSPEKLEQLINLKRNNQ